MFPELGHPESVGPWFNRAGARVCRWFQTHRCWFNRGKIRVIHHGGVKVRGSRIESNGLKALHPHLGLPWSWIPIILTGLALPGSPASTLLGPFLVEHIQPFFKTLNKMHLTTSHFNTTRPFWSWKGPSLIAETVVSTCLDRLYNLMYEAAGTELQPSSLSVTIYILYITRGMK